MPNNIPWSYERIEQLRALAAEDLSAEEIALRLGCTTRNAVIGQCSRNRIELFRSRKTGDGLAPKPRKRPRRPSAQIIRPKPLLDPTLTDIRFQCHAGRPISLMDAAEHHCRWVVGSPQSMQICGQNKRARSVYCGYHHDIAYQGRAR